MPPVGAAPKTPEAKYVRRAVLILGGAFLLLVGLGAGAYFYLTGSNEPPPPPPAPPKVVTVTPAPTPAPTTPTATPTTAAPVASDPVKAASSRPDPAPAPATTVTTAPEPAAPIAPPPPPPPSPRFVRYAEGLKISGVFQGSPARALVDGRVVREGDVLEPNLGIRFVAVDAATKHLVLQDGTGAQVRVKY